MSKKLFVGGLSWTTRDAELREAFERYGEVLEAQVVTDRDTGRSRGFGFVTYVQPTEADEAVQALDGTVLDGRTIRVTESQPKPRMGRAFGRDDRGSRW
jgi:RNA recognition motif-containing protein